MTVCLPLIGFPAQKLEATRLDSPHPWPGPAILTEQCGSRSSRTDADRPPALLESTDMARSRGFNLDEIRALLDLDGSGRASCPEVSEIASRHLANVRAKLADLASLEAVLSETVERCAANMSPECPVLGILDAAERVVVDLGRPDEDGAS